MRVIAGEARGRRLEALPGTDVTRPTLSQVKENMASFTRLMVGRVMSSPGRACRFLPRAVPAITRMVPHLFPLKISFIQIQYLLWCFVVGLSRVQNVK